MTSPLQALLWQYWARHRIGLSICAAAVAVLTISVPILSIEVLLASTLWTAIVSLTATAILGYTANVLALGSDVDLSEQSSYPNYMLRLPIPTWQLAAVPITLSLMLSSFAWLLARFLVHGRSELAVPYWLALYLSSVMVWMQYLCWRPMPSRLIRAPAFALYFLAGATLIGLKTMGWDDSTLALLALLGLLGGSAAVHAALNEARHRADVVSWSLTLPHHATWFPARALTTPAGALRWYSWRCMAFFLLLLIPLSVLLASFLFYCSLHYDERPFPHPLAPPGKALALTMSFLGFLYFQGLASVSGGAWQGITTKRRVTLPEIVSLMPVSCGELALIKLRQHTRWYLWSTAAIVAGMILGLTFWHDARSYFFKIAALDGAPAHVAIGRIMFACLIPLVVLWGFSIRFMFTLFAGRTWLELLDVARIVGTCAAIGTVIYFWWGRLEELRPLVPWILTLSVAAKACAGWWTFQTVRRHRLWPEGVLLRLTASWAIVTLIIVATAIVFFPGTHVSYVEMTAAAILLIPFSRMIALPAMIHWNRHR